MRKLERIEVGASDDAAGKAARVIMAGGVVIFPAERLYGLGADATSREAVERVFALKGRSSHAPLPVIVGDLDSAENWVEFGRGSRALASRFWPGPLTLVLDLKRGRELPQELMGSGKLGIRVPGSDLARRMAALAGVPVTATSANLSGRASGATVSEALADLAGEVELALDGGPLPGPPGSTVVAIEEEEVIILRPGVIPREELMAVLEEALS